MSPSQRRSDVGIKVIGVVGPRIHQVATLTVGKLVVDCELPVTNNPAMMEFVIMSEIAAKADRLIEEAAAVYGPNTEQFFTVDSIVTACCNAVNKPPSELVLGETTHVA